MKPAAVALAALLIVSAAAPAALAQSAAEASAPASTPAAEERAAMARLKALDESLRPQRGMVRLPGANVTLNLGEAYYFLGPEDARKVIVEGWGNPPQSAEGVLGMVVPAGKSPFEDIWSAVLTYQADGYVSDHDAKEIKPDQLLKDLRAGEPDSNRARREAGYPETHLAGWAQPPSYDAATHTLIWAQDIEFSGQRDHTLNYDVRVLGRRGVLSVNMVAGMKDLADVRAAARTLQSVVAYDNGFRYADYKDGDQKAAYGVAGLVATGLGLAAAKKVGLLAGLLLLLKKGWVFILAGLGAAGTWLRNLFGRKSA